MSEPGKQNAAYEDLYSIPENMTGEMIDPVPKTLEVFRLESGRWSLLGAFSEDDKVRVEPFEEIEISLSDLWLEETPPQQSTTPSV